MRTLTYEQDARRGRDGLHRIGRTEDAHGRSIDFRMAALPETHGRIVTRSGKLVTTATWKVEDGVLSIEGDFDEADARDLLHALRFHEIPATRAVAPAP